MSDNWIVGNLQSAFETWNGKISEIWSLITTTPQAFHGGAIWTTIVTINEALKAVGYGLLVLFFAMSVFQSAVSFRDFQRPEFVLRHFIRFLLAKLAVGSAMDIMTGIFSVCGSVVQTVMNSIGGMASASVSVPQEIVDAIEGVGFLASIPLWLVSLLGSLFITIMSFILILTVYGRFFRLYFYTALAPIPRLHGGCGHCPGLPHFLRFYVQRDAGGRYDPLRRHHELAVHRGNDLQYACPRWTGEGRRAHCQGDVRTVRICRNASQFETH